MMDHEETEAKAKFLEKERRVFMRYGAGVGEPTLQFWIGGAVTHEGLHDSEKKNVWKFCLKDLFMTEETMSEKIGHYSTKFRNQNATSMFKTAWA